MPKSRRIIHAPAVLDAFVEVVKRRLPLEFEGTRITLEMALQVLGYASVNRTTVEASCMQLADAPSGNRLREVLIAALPEPSVLQRQLNTILRSQLPQSMFKGKRDYEIALDITQIPYHGQPHERIDEIMRGAAKSGTTHFHGYVTVSVVHSRQRYVLAVLFAQLHDTMDDLVKRGLKLVQRLKIRIRRVLLDAGFCTVEVFRALDRRALSYIVPLKVRGKRGQTGGVRKLFQGRCSYQTSYTLNSPQHGTYTVKTMLVRRYTQGRFKRKGARWFAYAVAGLPSAVSCRSVFEWYRHRFGIESCYRQMNQVRARTSSRNPVFRLLLVGLALVLVNLYVALRSALSNCPTPSRACLSLRRIAALIIQAIEATLGCTPVFQRRELRLVS